MPRFAALPTPGKGIVNGLNDLLIPKARPGEPVLPPIIPPAVTAGVIIAARLALGRARFIKAAKVAFKVAVGGSVVEALVGLGVTVAVAPVEELAHAIKALFLPHRPLRFSSDVFTPEAQMFTPALQAQLVAQIRQITGPFELDRIEVNRSLVQRADTLGLLGLGGAMVAPRPGTEMVFGPDAGALGSFLTKVLGRYWQEMGAAGVGGGSAALGPLPGEKGDP